MWDKNNVQRHFIVSCVLGANGHLLDLLGYPSPIIRYAHRGVDRDSFLVLDAIRPQVSDWSQRDASQPGSEAHSLEKALRNPNVKQPSIICARDPGMRSRILQALPCRSEVEGSLEPSAYANGEFVKYFQSRSRRSYESHSTRVFGYSLNH